MAAIRFAPTLAFVILMLLSRSPDSSAREIPESMDKTLSQQQQQQQPSSYDVSSSFQAIKIGTRVKKLSGGGGGGGGGRGGGGGGGGGGRSGGGGRAGGGGDEGSGDEGSYAGGSGGQRATPGSRGGGSTWPMPGSVVRPIPGTHEGSSAVRSCRSTLGSVVSFSLSLGLLFASTLV